MRHRKPQAASHKREELYPDDVAPARAREKVVYFVARLLFISMYDIINTKGKISDSS